jgi:hypothetical protein
MREPSSRAGSIGTEEHHQSQHKFLADGGKRHHHPRSSFLDAGHDACSGGDAAASLSSAFARSKLELSHAVPIRCSRASV